MSRVHGSRSNNVMGGGRPGGGGGPAITPTNASVIEKQKRIGGLGAKTRDSSQWLPPVKRATGKHIQYFDHSEGRLKSAIKNNINVEKTDDLVPANLLENYRAGRIKDALLPMRLFQAGIALHPHQYKGKIGEALEVLEDHVEGRRNTKTAGFSPPKLPPKKTQFATQLNQHKRKLIFVSGGKRIAQDSPQAGLHGQGIEEPGIDKENHLESVEQKKRYETGDNIGPKNGIVKDREFVSHSAPVSSSVDSGYTSVGLNTQAKVKRRFLNMSDEQKAILRAKLVGSSSAMIDVSDREFKRAFS